MKPGSILDGKYELRRRIGNGAMGALWEGINTRTEREVAVKLIAPRGREEDRQRLLREARAGGRIRHPNVLDVYDVSETDTGSPFIVMELLKGETLAERLAKGPLELGVALRVLLDVARGLGAAHKAGVVHRNLQPHNVFLHEEADANQPIVKLVEFGISRIDAEETLTLNGVTLGSSGYVAPEQIEGADVDARADVWAFGALAYELFSGHPLFGGGTPAEILVQVTSAPVPELPSIAKELDRDLRALVSGCLLRDRTRRFDTIGECTTMVEAMLQRLAHPSMARVAERRPRAGLDDEEATTITSNVDPRERSTGRAPLSSDTEDPIPTLHYKRETKPPPADDKLEATPLDISIAEGTPIDPEADFTKTPLDATLPPDEDTDADDGEAPTRARDDVPSLRDSATEDEPTRPTSPPATRATETRSSSPPPRTPTVPPLYDPELSRRKVQMFQEALAPGDGASDKSTASKGASRVAVGVAAVVAVALVALLLSRGASSPSGSAASAVSTPSAGVADALPMPPAPSATSAESASAASAAVEPTLSAAASPTGSEPSPAASATAAPTASAKASRPRVVHATPRPPPASPAGTVYNPSSL